MRKLRRQRAKCSEKSHLHSQSVRSGLPFSVPMQGPETESKDVCCSLLSLAAEQDLGLVPGPLFRLGLKLFQ
jgi:hypothetical protein